MRNNDIIMVEVFVMYVPGSELSEFHKRSPWVMIPLSFKEIGYRSVLICGRYTLNSTYGIDVYSTLSREKSLLKSLAEPFLGFRRIFALKPDILLISPIGSYLFSIMPLILIYKIYTRITGSKKTKFVLKTDWSFDFTTIKWYKRIISILLLGFSSYTFDRISFETYCGVNRAMAIPIIRAKVLRRVPIGYPQNIGFDLFRTNSNVEKRIVCVARIAQMKGQIVLLKSFLQLSKNFPDWQLRFVGPFEDMNYKSQLDSLIQENNIWDKVSFTDFVKESVLLEELKKASIFCLPSIYGENAGNVKYEAIAAGLPVITTDVPCREDNEELGCLVSKARDINGLTKNLELLMANPQLRRDIAENSKKKLLSYKDIALLYKDL